MYKGASNTPLSLAIADYREGGKKSVISLRGGLNVITPANSGNGYIQYWTRDDAGDTDVDIHFCFGKQIGYWDVRRGDTDATWPEILERAKRSAVDIPNAMMDILGQRVHLQNTVNAFAKCAPNAIQAVVDMHDRMLDFEYLMMGLVKNNAVPANRFLASVLGEEVLTGTEYVPIIPTRKMRCWFRRSFIERIMYGFSDMSLGMATRLPR